VLSTPFHKHGFCHSLPFFIAHAKINRSDETIPGGDLIVIGIPALTVLRKDWGGRAGLTENEIADLGREGFIIKSARLGARTAVFIGGACLPKKIFILSLDN